MKNKIKALNKEWDIKYAFAKMFGFHPDVVDKLSAREVGHLIRRYNKEIRNQNKINNNINGNCR